MPKLSCSSTVSAPFLCRGLQLMFSESLCLFVFSRKNRVRLVPRPTTLFLGVLWMPGPTNHSPSDGQNLKHKY